MDIRREVEVILKATDKTGNVLTAFKNRLDSALGVPSGAVGAALAIGSIAAIAAASAVGVAKLTSQMIAFGSELKDAADRTGIAASKLAFYQYAAKRTGSDLSAFQVGLKMVSQAMAAGEGESNKGAQAMRDLGIQARNADGSLRPLPDVIADIAKKFKDLPDGAAKIALASDIFGRQGSTLIPLLNNLDELQTTYRRLNPVTDEFVEKADAAGDAALDLKTAWTGLQAKMSERFLPTVTGWMLDLKLAITKTKQSAQSFERARAEGTSTAGFTAEAPGTFSFVQRPVGDEEMAAMLQFQKDYAESERKRMAELKAGQDAEKARLDNLKKTADELGVALVKWQYDAAKGAWVAIEKEDEELMKEFAAAYEKLLAWRKEQGKAGTNDEAYGPPLPDDWAEIQRRRAAEPGTFEDYKNRALWEAGAPGGVSEAVEDEQRQARRDAEYEKWLVQQQEVNNLVDQYGGKMMASFGAVAGLAGAVAGIGETFGSSGEKWVQSLRKVQSVYQSILALVQAIKAAETIFAASGLAGGGVPCAPAPVHAASGMVVSGGRRGFDSVLAALMPGEGVVQKHDMARLSRMLTAFENGAFIRPGQFAGGRGGGGNIWNFIIGRPVTRSDSLNLAASAHEAAEEFNRRTLS